MTQSEQVEELNIRLDKLISGFMSEYDIGYIQLAGVLHTKANLYSSWYNESYWDYEDAEEED